MFPDEDDDISHSERFQKRLNQNPAGHLGFADDIAAAVGLLCSNRGGLINGQLLQINGGVVNSRGSTKGERARGPYPLKDFCCVSA